MPSSTLHRTFSSPTSRGKLERIPFSSCYGSALLISIRVVKYHASIRLRNTTWIVLCYDSLHGAFLQLNLSSGSSEGPVRVIRHGVFFPQETSAAVPKNTFAPRQQEEEIESEPSSARRLGNHHQVTCIFTTSLHAKTPSHHSRCIRENNRRCASSPTPKEAKAFQQFL